jgi:hypothetical protein
MNERIPDAKKPERKSSASADQVAVVAFHLYLEDGCQNGRDWAHWFKAEQLLKNATSAAATKMSRFSPAARQPSGKSQ